MSNRGEAEVEDFGDDGVDGTDDVEDVEEMQDASVPRNNDNEDVAGDDDDAIPSLDSAPMKEDKPDSEVKADDPDESVEGTHEEDAREADSDAGVNTSASEYNQDGLAADVIDTILEDARKEGSLGAVFDYQLSVENSTTMDLETLDAFLKVKKMRVDHDELSKLFEERIKSICPADSTGPGFTELYLFVTKCEEIQIVTKIVGKLRSAVMKAFTVNSQGNLGLAKLLQAEFGDTLLVKSDKVRNLFESKGISSIMDSDWSAIEEVFVDPLGLQSERKKKKKKRVHWPSLVRIVDAVALTTPPNDDADAQSKAATGDNVSGREGGDVNASIDVSSSPLSAEGQSPADGWKLLTQCKSLSEAIDLRMKQKDGSVFDKALSKEDFSAFFAKKGISENQVDNQMTSISRCFDTEATGTVDTVEYAKWAMRRNFDQAVVMPGDLYSDIEFLSAVNRAGAKMTSKKLGKNVEKLGKLLKASISVDDFKKAMKAHVSGFGKSKSEAEDVEKIIDGLKKVKLASGGRAEGNEDSEADEPSGGESKRSKDKDGKKKKAKKGKDKDKKNKGSNGQIDALAFGRALVAGGGMKLEAAEKVMRATLSSLRASGYDYMSAFEAVERAGRSEGSSLKRTLPFRKFVRTCNLMGLPMTAMDCAAVAEQGKFLKGKMNKRKVNYGALIEHFEKSLSISTFDDMCETLTKSETSWAETRINQGSNSEKKKKKKKKKGKKNDGEDPTQLSSTLRKYVESRLADTSEETMSRAALNAILNVPEVKQRTGGMLDSDSIFEIINMLDPEHDERGMDDAWQDAMNKVRQSSPSDVDTDEASANETGKDSIDMGRETNKESADGGESDASLASSSRKDKKEKKKKKQKESGESEQSFPEDSDKSTFESEDADGVKPKKRKKKKDIEDRGEKAEENNDKENDVDDDIDANFNPGKGDSVVYNGEVCTVVRMHKDGTYKLQAVGSSESYKNIPVSDLRPSRDSGDDDVDDDEEDSRKKKKKKKKKKEKKKNKRSRAVEDDDDDEEFDKDFANESNDKLTLEEWNKKRFDGVLRKAFDNIDTDKSGKLDEHEMGIALRSTGAALTDSEIADLMMQADEDGDGQIDFREFRHVVRKRNAKSANDRARIAKETLSRIMKLFRGMDTENVGYIKADRFRSIVMNVMGISLTKREWMVRLL